MGSAQSYLTPEAAVTAIVVAGAVGLGFSQVGNPAAATKGPDATAEEGTKKGKKKKQSKATAGGNTSEVSASKGPSTEPEPRVVAFPAVIPGQFETAPAPIQLDSSAPEAISSKAKKSKKKKGTLTIGEDTSRPISSSVDYLSESSAKAAPRPKNSRRSSQIPQSFPASAADTAIPPSTSSTQIPRPLHLSTTSIDTDGSWTRVGSRGSRAAGLGENNVHSAEPTTSDAGVTTSHTGNSSPAAERTEDDEPDSFLLQQASQRSASRGPGEPNRKTLAEKLLPKPRKTGVDDMLETPDYPTLSRVMRVTPLPNEKPAVGFSWADYEDVRVTTDGGENDADGEDDGWGVVSSKRPKRTNPSGSTSLSSSQPPKAPETLTKKQRQNLQKRDSQKSAKLEAEAERLATLGKHKRELEKVRMAEQFGKSGGKTPSGGMKATVDDRGKLVWE